MKYWVYINNNILGPVEEDQIDKLEGFTMETLVSPEVPPEGKTEDWKPASELPVFKQGASAAQTAPVGSFQPEISGVAQSTQNKVESQAGQQGDSFTQDQPMATISQAGQQGESFTQESASAEQAPIQFENPIPGADMGPSPQIPAEQYASASPATSSDPVSLSSIGKDFSAGPTPEAPNSDGSLVSNRIAELDKNISGIAKMIENMAKPASPMSAPGGNDASAKLLQGIDEIRSVLIQNLQATQEILARMQNQPTLAQPPAQSWPQATATETAPASVELPPAADFAPQQEQTQAAAPSRSTQTENKHVEVEIYQAQPGMAKRLGNALKGIFKALAMLIVIVGLGGILIVLLIKQKLLPPAVMKMLPLDKVTALVGKQPVAATFPTTETPQPAAPGTPETAANPQQPSAPAVGQQPAPQTDPNADVLKIIKAYQIKPTATLEQLILSTVPLELQQSVEWQIKMMDQSLYVVTIKVPPSAPNSWVKMYRFDYTTANNVLTPTNNDSQELLSPPKQPAQTVTPQKTKKRKIQ